MDVVVALVMYALILTATIVIAYGIVLAVHERNQNRRR
jgi:hypothetical protein